ncbi:MAG: TonB-dependent receptor [Acidobacteria bacterium]|nr:TonB-dependent receptor [Acidobacteriota bacterium]
MGFRRQAIRLVLTAITIAVFIGTLMAQTITTGQLSGTVTDPSGAVMPNVPVTLKSLDDGSVTSGKTTSQGYYEFAYLKPGNYSVGVNASGFQAAEKKVAVSLGAVATANFQLALGSSTTTVEVSGTGAAVETEDANLTANFNSKQLDLLPNAGNDLSAVALTAPGAVVNTAGGAMFGGGNFEVNGLPATSNLFTLDGSNDNDPYFNVNNSGATNLTLGLNDVQESTVVSNGYSGSYGGLAGANINYVTKSGTNNFHGNATYWWNGDILDANNYFRVQANHLAGSNVDPRPFVNANQYAGSFGGPIKKDKAFFFFDIEGLELAIPSPQTLFVPTPGFQSAVIGNLNARGLSASVPLYQTMFGLYNRVSQAGAKQVSGGGCSDVTTVNGVAFGTANPCTVQVQAALTAHTHDRLYVGKVDYNITNDDKFFARVEREHGLQATYTDGIDPAFNGISDQPQWQGQVGETHTFGTSKVNDFKASLLWYSAFFKMQNQSAADQALPINGGSATIALGDGSMSALNPDNFVFPQGRNITQYQFVDDFSWIRGQHNFKVGINFHKDDVTDGNFFFVTPQVLALSLANFATGGTGGAGSAIFQAFPQRLEQRIGLYQLGFYGSDDVRLTKNLKLTLSLRFDHLANPTCQANCFQRLAPNAFGNSTAPVNTAILSGLHTAFPSVSEIVPQPKIGFAWTPGGAQKTVFRGGVGMFSDALPTGAIDNFMQNAPLDPQFFVGPGFLSPAQTGSVNGVSGTLYQTVAAADAAFKANYASGGVGCAIAGANPATCVPTFNFYNSTAVHVPIYYKWSMEVQQSIGWNTTLNILYVGNHGEHEEFSNLALNAYCCIPSQITPTGPIAGSRYANLPATVPDSRFAQVADAANIANSNYHGLIVSANHAFSGGFQFQASYTWSHATDEISNNSLSPFGLNTVGQYADIVFPQNPFNPRANYGNADYDVRHNFTMNYVWSDAFRHLTSHGPSALLKGWTFSGTIFAHTGLPFTVYSSAITNALETTNYASPGGAQDIFSSEVAGPANCGSSAATVSPTGAGNPCMTAANWPDPTTTYGNQRRNQNRGPSYFDTDFAVEKAFGIPKWEGAQFSLGARFFNLFNHPNFYFPIMNANSPAFGTIIQTALNPTGIYGSGLGADNSVRAIQLQAKFQF